MKMNSLSMPGMKNTWVFRSASLRSRIRTEDT